MFRVPFAVLISLFSIIGPTFCLANIKTDASTPTKGTNGDRTHEIPGDGTGIYILDKKGDTVKILESDYEELNIFCHTGN